MRRRPSEHIDGELWMAARTATAIYHGDVMACWRQFSREFLQPARRALRVVE
jgi:hypothetical protein